MFRNSPRAVFGRSIACFFLPFSLFWLLSSEIVLMPLLIGKKTGVNPVLGPLLLAVFYFALPPLIQVLNVQLEQRLKRKLVIDPKGLKRPGTNSFLVRWPRVARWWLEPVTDSAELRRLQIEYLFRRGKRRRRWSMILRKPEQTDLLKTEVAQIRQSGVAVPELIELTEPLPAKLSTRQQNMWPALLSMFYMWNAFIFLAIGFGIRKSRTENPQWPISGNNDAPLIRFVTRPIFQVWSNFGAFF